MEHLYDMIACIYQTGQRNTTRLIGWYYLFIIMYMAGYDNANDSRKYIPAKHRATSRMIARVDTNMATNDLTWMEAQMIHMMYMRSYRRRVAIARRSTHHHYTRKRRGNYLTKICALTAVSMQATRNGERFVQFDTDSAPIGVDNRCTAYISHAIEDFEGPLEECNRAIKGFRGTRTEGVQIGTLKWKWLDDSGRAHTFLIPKSYYVPQGKVRLLSPQHWAQTRKDFSPTQGTTSETTARHVILRWNQRQHTLTIPLGRTDNVATFHMAPGYNKYSTFCAEAAIDDTDGANPLTIDPTIISDD